MATDAKTGGNGAGVTPEELGEALGTDFLEIRGELGEQELDYLDRTRRFVSEEVLPVIGGYWERAEFPFDLARRMGELGLLGAGIQGYGCPPMSLTSAGLIMMELSRGDGSLGTFLGVQADLAMRAIDMYGSEEHKNRWLPPLAKAEAFGAFALTEPEHGSDSVALETTAARDGDEFVLRGRKRWIGNGTIADVVVVWARGEDGQVGGYLVEKGTPGYERERHRGQGLAARGVAGRHRPAGRPRPGGRQAAGGEEVQGHGEGPRRDAQPVRVCGARACRRRLRRRADLRQAAPPVRQAAGRVPDRAVKLAGMITEIVGMQLYCLRVAQLADRAS